jgi:hypothetical protein
VFRFYAVYVQRRFIFSRHFLMFRSNWHHQVYSLLWWRNLLLIVMMCCFSYVVASSSSFCGLSSCFIWVSLNNCYARVCLICNMWCVMLELYFKVRMYCIFGFCTYDVTVLLVCRFVACPECFCLGGSLLYGGWPSLYNKLLLKQKHSGQPQATNQQNLK